MTEPAEASWQWDRKVPIALIVTLIVMFVGQSGATMWWAAKMDSRIETLEKASLITAPQGDRLTRVEVKLESVQTGIGEIKAILREGAASKRN